jgi:hypothetical protein
MADRNRVETSILEKAREGKIPCAVCFKIAEESGIAKKEMGTILNEMKIKIGQCQLGCFE